MKKKRIVDFVDDEWEYGRTAHEDGVVIPFCRLHTHKYKEDMFWDNINKKWIEVNPKWAYELVEGKVFSGFVDDDNAPHGYCATHKKAMVLKLKEK